MPIINDSNTFSKTSFKEILNTSFYVYTQNIHLFDSLQSQRLALILRANLVRKTKLLN